MNYTKDFRFDFLGALKCLCHCDDRLRNELAQFLEVKSWSFQGKQNLLQKLAELFLIQHLVPYLVKHCRPILLEILERGAQILQHRSSLENEGFCYILSGLLPLSHLKNFIHRFMKASCLFRIFSQKEHNDEQSNERILCVLKTGYNLLCYDFETFCRVWDWSFIFKLLQHRHPEVRWYALHIVAILTEMSEQVKHSLLDKLLSIEEKNSISIHECLTRESWSLREQCVIRYEFCPMASDSMDVDTSNTNESCISDKDLIGEYATICGVLLPKLPGTSGLVDKSLVMVPSTVSNLHSLVLSVVSGHGVLLEGPIGSGKSSLVEYLARVTGRTSPPDFIKVQLGDQTDSKSLLGTYVCTDTPGEFVWQPGPLLQAVQAGHWILLEDIDLAPMDVISVLIPLLESQMLSVPAHGNAVKASPGFQLFATQRLYSSLGGSSYQATSANSAILDKLWTRVQIEPLSKEELICLVHQKYADLEAVATKLVDIYCLLSTDPHLVSNQDITNCSLPYKRLSSTRDFIKWCSRVAVTACGAPTLLDYKDVFLEAQDCFSAPLAKTEERNLLDMAVGAKLGLTNEKVEFFFRSYKPKVHTSPLSLTVGRITLKRKHHDNVPVHLSEKNIPKFAHTRHSLVLLEKVSACIRNNEPVLLVGETGTGKTSTVQYLAAQCSVSLKVVNMSQQSDSSDLLGGFKPVEMKQIVAPVREKFEVLFCKTFSRKQNVKFLGHVQKCFAQGQWEMLFKLMMHCQKNAVQRVKKDHQMSHLLSEWQSVNQDIQQLQKQQKNAESALAFRFVEGTLVKAVQKGDWVLLDEINLATPETLECLCGLLESSSGSVVLMERGDVIPTLRHEDFRLFACMNPATDVGKKDLPPGIRNRFTEVFVCELESTADLKTLVVDYLQGLSPNAAIVDGIVRFYLTVKHEANDKLADGTGHKPHYSLRTLCRALKYAATNPHQNALRSIYEGFCLSFLTQLDHSSHPAVQSLIKQHLLGHVNAASMLKQPLPMPQDTGQFCNFEGFWIAMGSKELVVSTEYVLTASVKANLKDLGRVVSARKLPVLIQGETSVGKTSLIQWLAKASGNHCVRINNHEHTDIQEYLGCYTSDANGKLVFKEGVLVDAMRKGHWIILDELNLAPSDVLEALNRLLDDNRELFIPETQETVVAHPMFMLFATQNPPGHYGGRKVLSRAFRNRFVELHFNELPSKELEIILHKRCSLPPSYAKKLVSIMLDLQARRRSTNVFAGKQGFITLRDLFRWAERYSKTPDVEGGGFHDWDQHLAEDGYMLLAGRCRNPSECKVIQEVIELHMKRKLDPDMLFGDASVQRHSTGIASLMAEVTTASLEGFRHVVWTHSMRRLAVLAGRALQFGEPVLLVGETGCGKTTICQLFASLWNQKLFAVNCHMHSESADFLGGLRPVRHKGQEEQKEQVSKLFEWCDGPLVQAMKEGAMFLVDEISLADDSVLERLNSVLEPERTLVLAEKGGGGHSVGDVDVLIAHKDFKIIGTMNPGGDFGKKELSPALRNRFTEIWCPPANVRADLIKIIEHNIKPGIKLKSTCEGTSGIGDAILDFIEWFHSKDFGKKFVVSIRDLLSWVNFINTCSFSATHNDMEDKVLLPPALAYVHGACLVFLDALGSGSSSSVSAASSSSSSSSSGAVKDAYQVCFEFLSSQVEQSTEAEGCFGAQNGITSDRTDVFGVSPFFIPRGPLLPPENFGSSYTLSSPTTSQNAQRVLRALQLPRPILLEGSPGVGKTSLVGAIAKASGHELIRINLSEQTDVTDLFGADLPVEGGEAGHFVWRDGPMLKALKAGHWIVLDELNLASQSVLEGLNACLDHRAEVYIPELGMTFKVQHKKTRLFACQNPLNQGGGRKGLPKSFLNRFTQVYVEPLSKPDLLFITEALYPQIDHNILEKMVIFNQKIHQETVVEGRWGRKGSPWELNLRDVFRWCDLLIKHQSPGFWDPSQFVHLIYCDRMRTVQDKQMVLKLFKSIFENSEQISNVFQARKSFYITPTHVQVGHSWLPRCASVDQSSVSERPLQVLHHCLPAMESLMTCLDMNWMVILVGPRSCGKTSLVHLVAQLTGNRLEVMAMNSAMDTTELLGGFEQADLNRQFGDITAETKCLVLNTIRQIINKSDPISLCLQETASMYNLWTGCQESKASDKGNLDSLSHEKLDALQLLLTSVQEICCRYNIASSNADSIMETLQSLRSKLIANGDNSHCGGQFEWVDGQLVEALKSGYWLLIDNVNFCSPSVLDRLNALLEPGGILTIDERGAIDGHIPSIKPHPNFRLILAMDPRYGEISRAMRNRGVEIFMLGEEDGDMFDDYDRLMMLHGLGLEDKATCDSLVTFQKDFKRLVGGSVLDMLHAASLTRELLERGSDALSAITTSLKQVYLRNQVSEQSKQITEDMISKHISTLTSLDAAVPADSIPEYFPSAAAYHANSVVSMIKLQSLPLIHILKSGTSVLQLESALLIFLETSSSYDWKLRLNYLQSVVNAISANRSFFQGQEDATMRVKSFIQSFELMFSNHLMDNLRKEFKDVKSTRCDSHMLDYLPFDLRLNSDILSYLKEFSVNVSSLARISSLANRLFLLELEARRSYFEKKSLPAQSSLTGNLIQLSHGFHSGHLQLESLPHPVVVHLLPFSKLLASFLRDCICEVDELSDKHYWMMVDGLAWRDRLWSMCEKQTRENFSISVLSLHWGWVVQHTLNSVQEAFGSFNHSNQSGELVTVITQLKRTLETDSKMAEAYFKILAAYGHPPPFRSQTLYQIWERTQRLCQEIDKHVKLGKTMLEEKVPTCKITEVKTKFIEVMRIMLDNRLEFNEECFSQCDSILTSLEETITRSLVPTQEIAESVETFLELDMAFNENTSPSEVAMNQVLLPLFDDLCYLQEQSVLGCLMLGMVNQMACRATFQHRRTVKEQLEALTCYQLEKTSIEPETQAYYHHWQVISTEEHNMEAHYSPIFQSLESEVLFKCLMLRSHNLWNQSNQERQGYPRQDVDSKESSICCLLGGTRNLLDSLSSKKPVVEGHFDALTSILIGKYHDNIEQLQVLSKHVWINGDFLDNHYEVERRSSTKLFISKLFQVLLSVKEILPPTSQLHITGVLNTLLIAITNENALDGIISALDTLKDVVLSVSDGYRQATGNGKQAELILNLLTECLEGMSHLQHLQKRASDDTQDILWDSICRGKMWVQLGLVLLLILSPVGRVDPVEKNCIELQHVKEEIQRLEEELKVRYYAEEYWTGLKTSSDQLEALLLQECWSESQLTSNPWRARQLLTKLKELRVQAQHLDRNSAFRPSISQFEAILVEVKHYMSTVGNTSTILSLIDSLSGLASLIFAQLNEGILGNIQLNAVSSAVNKAKAWYTSAERFVQRLKKEHPLYCDLLGPFVAGVSQVIYGVSLTSAKLSTLFQQYTFRLQLPVDAKSQFSGPDEVVLLLCQFPVSSSSSCLDTAVSLMSPSVDTCIQGMAKYLQGREMAASASALVAYRILRLSILYLRNHSIQHGFVDSKMYQAVASILAIFLEKWKIFKEQEREREEEEGSLFKFRNKSHGSSLTEDEENKISLSQAFPTFDGDFKDIMAPQDLNESVVVPQVESESSTHASKSDAELFMSNITDFSEIRKLHEETFCRFPSSRDFPLDGTDRCPVESLETLYLETFQWSYQTAAVMNAIIPWSHMEDKLSWSHLLQSCILKGHFQTDYGVKQKVQSQSVVSAGTPFNIYHDSSIQEVVKVKPVLKHFMARVHELLVEWPRHPNLLQLLAVVQRILSFPVTSPVMKILTGLEVLLRKAQDWESNAAKHVSLKDHLDNVTSLIIQWRKMELKCWSSLLDVATVKAARKASQWWFHIYNSLEQFRTRDEGHEVSETIPKGSELIEPLQRFIESSTLGEFASRVQMLFAFYKEMCYEEGRSWTTEVSDVLWNLFSYYKQFIPCIEQTLQEMRKPIEKDLKDFVKIAKWNDSNFWAMKQAADKSHHTLHKFVRKYEASLNEPVQKTLMNVKKALGSPEERKHQTNERKCVQSEWFTSPDNLKVYCVRDRRLVSAYEEYRLCVPLNQTRLPKLFQKMRQLSQKIMNQQEYMLLVKSLDGFTGEVIATSNELQALDVTNQPKEKQAEMRKHIQQRKRKSLSDLFKMLSSLGVSYRKGLNLEHQSTGKEAMLLATVDEEAIIKSVRLLSDRSPDLLHEVEQLMEGCCHQYYKSLARSAAFTVAMVTPSKELSIGDIDRCKGCSQHILHVCYDQRKVIAQFSRNIRSASVCLRQLTEAVGLPNDDSTRGLTPLPPQRDLQKRTLQLMALLTHTAQILQQMSILLKCCPSEKVSLLEWSPLPQSMLSPLAMSSADDVLVTEMTQTLKGSVEKVQQLSKDVRPYAAESDNELNYTNQDDDTAFIATWRQFTTVLDAFVKLENIAEAIDEMLPKFSSHFCPADKGFGGPLTCLKNKILKECREFHAWRTEMLTERSQEKLLSEDKMDEQGVSTLNSFINGVESLNTSLLLAVQRLARTAENSSKESSIEGKDVGVNETGPDDNVENLQLQDGHLTTLLHQSLLDDINSLDVNNVTKAISSLMSQLKDMADLKGSACSSPFQLSSIGFCAQLLSSSIPLLHQYLNLSQNLLVNLLAAHRATSKLLSVLLSIFTDLASKGFCLPPEIEEGEGDGATEFEDIEGGGIGEGEGMKDVSDQIENEDQLEDAKQEGQEQEKKDENQQQQIPDEENGVEMSENFEGALHDVETGEEEENENSEEEHEDEADLDKQMGEVDGQDTEKLDEKIWGDSDEEDEREEQEMKEEKGTGAEAESQSQLVAKEDNKGSAEESKEKADQQPGDDEDQNEEKPNEADEDEKGNLSDEGEEDQEGAGQQRQEGPPDTDEPANLDLPDDLQLDEEGHEESEDQGEEMDTEDIEKDEANTGEAEDESPGANDEEMDGTEDGEEEQMEDEEKTEGIESSEKQDEGESPKEEQDAVAENDQEEWKTNADTQSQDNVQAVEDSGAGEGIGEQSDITAGQSESTEDSEEQGVGRAEALNNEGHHGESRQSTVQAPPDTNQQSRQRKQMNRARSDRTLGSMDETTHKRLKTIDKTEQDPGAEANKTTSQDLFQHMQNEDPSTPDAQTLDSATADQAKEQEKANFPEMHSDGEDEGEEEMKSALLEENDELSTPDKPRQSRLPLPIKPQITADNEDGGDAAESEAHEGDMETNDGEEMTAERLRSTYHSSNMALAFERLDISSLDPEKLRSDLEHQLAEWSNMDRGTAEEQQAAQEAWRKYELLTSSLSQELCEQLRLVLEPSLATKLKGDYRSGKRLNMRKVIPYIASQFRKDKIWLKRTKPSKRQYQIMLAVDDSSSMNDNHSKQLAFESLAVISNALTRLEAGDVGVCSFGETVRLLHPFHEPFTDHSGARILQQFTFEQKKTKIAQLLDTCTSLMLSAHSRLQVSPRMRRDTSQLLLIVSDGRGIFLEGMETVQKAVRIAREASIFMVFVILDNPANKDSVLDIRVPIFRPGKLPEIKSYMEQFPFPFYIILRDINALPLTLSDALRQWFELVSSMD